jgi:hypothetical protein
MYVPACDVVWRRYLANRFPLGNCPWLWWCQEFFAQGDREKAEGLPVSPNMDRATTKQGQLSVNFVGTVESVRFGCSRGCTLVPCRFHRRPALRLSGYSAAWCSSLLRRNG